MRRAGLPSEGPPLTPGQRTSRSNSAGSTEIPVRTDRENQSPDAGMVYRPAAPRAAGPVRAGLALSGGCVDGHVQAGSLESAEAGADLALPACVLVVPAGTEVGESCGGVREGVPVHPYMFSRSASASHRCPL